MVPHKFSEFDITTNLNAIRLTDTLRDCRKSPKRAILAILHVMKSYGYEHQKHKFRVFRQSLQKHAIGIHYSLVGVIKD